MRPRPRPWSRPSRGASRREPGALQLVPFAKAYSGLSDAEFAAVDRVMRAHTLEKFGPVRSVRPTLVFELAFEGVNRSPRHKSGIAVRFPRMLRLRPDKPLHEADTLVQLQALLDGEGGGNARMALKGGLVFLSAFLLFLVQPIIAKLILPRFGGSVAVWATCLVFFQAALLLGYALAHALVRSGQARSAVGAPCAAAGQPAVAADPAWQPVAGAGRARPGRADPAAAGAEHRPAVHAAGDDQPAAAGLDRRCPARQFNPYRLFALSNLASLAALLAYPWLIEPWLRTATQAHGLVAGLCGVCAGAAVHQPAPAGARPRPPPGRPGRMRGAGVAAHLRLDGAGGAGQLRAGGRHQPPDAEHPVLPDDVGAAAGDLPGQLHAVFRRRPLVCAARLPRCRRWWRCW